MLPLPLPLRAVLLAVLLGSCWAFPRLLQPLEYAGEDTPDAASWTGRVADSNTPSRGWHDSVSSEERIRHPELNSADGVSRWADVGMENDLWNAIVSESSSGDSSSGESSSGGSSSGDSSSEYSTSEELESEESGSLYKDDSEYESPPPLTDHRSTLKITDEPGSSPPDFDQVVKYGDLSGIKNESDDSDKNVGAVIKDENLAVGNSSEASPIVGSEQFEEELGAALKDTLHKVKMVLAAQGAGRRRDEGEDDWRQGLSRLRVKRSDDQEADEDSSALDELPVNSLNDIVDLFVIIARQALQERGLDQVSIPPLERNFSRSLGVGTLRGFFRGDGGWVRRLTTVRRLGDVWLDRGPRPPSGDPRDGRSVSVATSLGLEELMVGFERYVADVRALPTVSGRLMADIEENAVLLNISFSKRDDDPKGCDVNLQHLRVLQLSGINMKLTGLGPLNWLLSRIATWLTTHSQEKVAAVVEKELIAIANKEIGRIPCDADFITALYML